MSLREPSTLGDDESTAVEIQMSDLKDEVRRAAEKELERLDVDNPGEIAKDIAEDVSDSILG